MDINQTKRSLKTFLTLGVMGLAAFGVAYGGRYAYTLYVGAGAGDEPKNVKVLNITNSSSSISWTTDKETYGFVEYGSTENLGLVAQDVGGEKLVTHQVDLKNLLPNTKYYYKVGSGSETYGADSSGIPYSFVTEASASAKSTSGTSGGLTEKGFEDNYYTSNVQYDLNKDGEVNSLDYELWKSTSTN